jgi:hypothetical protein
MGIYADNGLGKPGALILDAGTVSTASGFGTITISQILTGGIYWFAMAEQGGTPPVLNAYTSWLNGEIAGAGPGWFQGSISGALPNPASTGNLISTSMPQLIYTATRIILVPVNQAYEDETALPIVVDTQLPTPGAVNVAVETDIALPINVTSPFSIPVGVAEETDTAQTITPTSPLRNLVTSGSNADVASYETTSYTPVGNRLILATIQSRPNNLALTPATPTMTGNGLTWVQVATKLDDSGDHRVTMFRAMVASPTEGTATIDFGGQLQEFCMWSIIEVRGTDTSGTNGSGAIVQSATGTATAESVLVVALSALASSNNYAFGGFGIVGYRTVFTSPNTTVGSFGISANATVVSEYAPNTTVAGVILSAAATIMGIAVEIKTV